MIKQLQWEQKRKKNIIYSKVYLRKLCQYGKNGYKQGGECRKMEIKTMCVCVFICMRDYERYMYKLVYSQPQLSPTFSASASPDAALPLTSHLTQLRTTRRACGPALTLPLKLLYQIGGSQLHSGVCGRASVVRFFLLFFLFFYNSKLCYLCFPPSASPRVCVKMCVCRLEAAQHEPKGPREVWASG